MQHCYRPITTKRTTLCSLEKCILKTTLTIKNNASKTTNLITSLLLNDENNENKKTSAELLSNVSNKENGINNVIISTIDSKIDYEINSIGIIAINTNNNSDADNNTVAKNDASVNGFEYNKKYEISRLFLLFFFDHLLQLEKEIFSITNNKKYIERNFLENPKQCYCLVA